MIINLIKTNPMKEIGTISLERMNNGAHFLYISNILARAETDTAIKAKATAQITALKTALAAEDEALKLTRKSLLTDDIAQADTERDTLLMSYKKAVTGFLSLPVEAMAKAAKILNQHLKDYDIDPRAQLDKETGLLINLIADLEGQHASHVATLSLTPFVSALKAANEKVRALTLERTDERTGHTIGALKSARKGSDNAYRALVKMVNAIALIEGEASYAPFIDYVNTEIAHYKQEVLGQRPASPTPEPPAPETPAPENPGGSGSESPDEI